MHVWIGSKGVLVCTEGSVGSFVRLTGSILGMDVGGEGFWVD